MIPVGLCTPHLLLRPWRADDAEALHPILVANYERLAPWIPSRVATPAPLAALADRLSGFAAEFDADREWRFAMLKPDETTLLGEIDLFPRSASGRVHVSDADRAEIGYWIRADESGRGLVTEGVRAMIDVARQLDRFAHLEIRCDERNAPSGAIPKRLGFQLSATVEEPAATPEHPGARLQIWKLARPGPANA
jgi:ribosomal-protein-serine acetyltransferase